MHTKILKIFLFVSVLAACNSKPIGDVPQTSVPVVMSPTQTLTLDMPTPEIVHTATASITQTKAPQATALPTQTPLPSQTTEPTAVTWEILPKLSEVVLSKADFAKIDSWYSRYPLQKINAKDEIETCLWDCAKYRFSNQERRWTIILLRAGDSQKALSTAQKLKMGFLDAATYEYTPDVLSGMLPDSWLIVHKPADKYFLSFTTGLSYGNIVILITGSMKTCFDMDEGFICEGDLYSLADDVSQVAKAQIHKLAASGYPK